jgi:hypothetical protein
MESLSTHVIVYVPSSDTDMKDEAFITLIKSLGSNWHPVPDVWIVESGLTGKQIYESMLSLLVPDDRLFISRLANDTIWQGFDWPESEWLRRKMS